MWCGMVAEKTTSYHTIPHLNCDFRFYYFVYSSQGGNISAQSLRSFYHLVKCHSICYDILRSITRYFSCGRNISPGLEILNLSLVFFTSGTQSLGILCSEFGGQCAV